MIVRELLTRLGFQVDEKGADQYEKRFGSIQRHAATLQRNLGGILGSIGVGMTFMFFKDVTSQFTDLESRLANNLGADGAANAMKRLHDVALLTYQPTEQLVEGFISMQSALNQMNLSVDQQIDLQQSIADGFTATGVKGDQAARSLMWINRAFTKGKVTAEEFNGILEAGGDDLLAILAESLGKTTGELRDMATAGQLTADVLTNFFLKRMPDFRRQSEQMPITINDAIGRVQEAFRWWIYETDKASGASQAIVPVIMFFAEHIEILAGTVTALMIPALMGLVVWVASTTAAFAGLALALLANPITWVVAGIALLVLAIQDLYMWITGGNSLIGQWLGPWEDVVAKMRDAWLRFVEPFQFFWTDLKALMQAQDLADAWQALCDLLVDIWLILWQNSITGILVAIMPDLFKPLEEAWDTVIDYVRQKWDEFWTGLKTGIASLPGEVSSSVKNAWNKFWGNESDPTKQALPGRATGGPVTAGRAYMVGEDGPEEFVPKRSGWILPHGLDQMLSGGFGPRATVNNQTVQIGDVSVNLDVTLPPGSDKDHGQRLTQEVASRVQAALREAIASTLPSFPEVV